MQGARVLAAGASEQRLVDLFLPLAFRVVHAVGDLVATRLEVLEVRRSRVARDAPAERGAEQRVGTEPVRPVVREVAFAAGVEAGDGRGVVLGADVGHSAGLAVLLVADPQAAHGVVHGGEDLHGVGVGVDAGEGLVHVEDAAEAGLQELAWLVRQVEIHDVLAAHAHSHVAGHADEGARGNVARARVAVGGIPLFEEVEPLVLGDVAAEARVAGLARHPDASALAAAGFGHQPQLVVALHGGGVELGELAVGELGALLVGPGGGGPGAVGGHRRAAPDEAGAAGGQEHDVGAEGLDLHGADVERRDAAADALLVEYEREELPELQFSHAATAFVGADLLVDAVEELGAGRRAGKARPSVLHAAEEALVHDAFGRAAEGDAHAVVGAD